MKTKTSGLLMTMKNLLAVPAVLFTILVGYPPAANATPDQAKQRAQADLNGECLELFLSDKSPSLFDRSSPIGYQYYATALLDSAVFAFGEIDSRQYCGYGRKAALQSWETAEKIAIATCERRRPKGGSPCVVYARNNDIVYVSPHKEAKVGEKDPTVLTPTERTENELVAGNVVSVTSKVDRANAIAPGSSSEAWSKYQEMVAEQQAIHEKKQQEQAKKDAIDAIEAKLVAEQNAVQARKQQEQAKIDAIQAQRETDQRLKQVLLDGIKAEREEQQKEEIRRAEAKRIAIEGDGSADDITCKSFGARPGSDGYVNCRVQLSRTKQLVDEQQAAQNASTVAAEEKAKNYADFTSNKKCADETKNPACMNNAGTYALRLGNKGDARDWWTLAARYGDSVAIKNLTKNGFPVPEPDLLREQQQAKNSDSAAFALKLLLGGVNAYQKGKKESYRNRPTPSYTPEPSHEPSPNILPPEINCTTDVIGTSVYTKCR